MSHDTTTRPRPFNVLIVDDDEADFYLAKESLEASEWPVEISYAKDGHDALCLLRESCLSESKEPPDLILLDLNMPRVSGHELLEAINDDDQIRPTPVLVLSTSSSPEDVQKSYVLNANGHVKKPSELEEYVAVVQAIGQFWFEVAEFLPQDR